MAVQITGASGVISNTKAGSAATENSHMVTLPKPATDAAIVGAAIMVSENDSGAITGSPEILSPETSDDYRLRVGIDTILFNDHFNATAQNTGSWRYVFTTMTTTMAGGFVTMNANSTATATTGTALQTWAYFPLLGASQTYVEFTATNTSDFLGNQVVEFGQFIITTTTAPADGVYFRITSAGTAGVVNYNGNEVTFTPVANATAAQNSKYVIAINERDIGFWRDDVLLGGIDVPSGNGQPFMTTSLPVGIQQRNSGTVTGSPQAQWKTSNVVVSHADLHTTKPWPHQMALTGRMAYQGQNGGTMGSTALYTNSLAAGAGAAMTNTTAALGVGLGGQFSTQPTLAAGTDGILCSYLNPAGGINQTPRKIIISGVRVQGAVVSALTGGPVIYAYSLAFGHTALSLATAETGSFVTATAKAPRRIALGFETYVVTAAAGVMGQGVYMQFRSPVVVNPGEYVAVVAKNLGTVTSAGVITVLVTFDAYLE